MKPNEKKSIWLEVPLTNKEIKELIKQEVHRLLPQEVTRILEEKASEILQKEIDSMPKPCSYCYAAEITGWKSTSCRCPQCGREVIKSY